MGEEVMDVRVDFPGLLIEQNRNGSPRYRVRVEGDKKRRITIPVAPDHPDFANHYHAARAGEIWQPGYRRAIENSLDWLVMRYLDHFEKTVAAGTASADTLRQKRSVLGRMLDHCDEHGTRYGDCDIDAPSSAFVEIRDAWGATPGAADNMIRSVRALYKWAIEREYVDNNPAAGIAAINTASKGGAVPWTPDDLRKFKEKHPPGTTAYLWLTLQAFTACRVGDAIWLGRDQEVTRNGQIWLDWQPRKKGSAFVSIPMLPPLYQATRAATVVGPTYLLGDLGKPFGSSESLRNRIRKWCDSAGLCGKSSHGVRKAVAQMMAEAGCTQHQIMSVMAHTQAKTSEIYTKRVERRKLAEFGAQALAGIKW